MTVEFLSPLDVRKGAGRLWQLLAPLVFAVDGEKSAVPAGFETDFASVPRLPLVFMLAGDTAHKAAAAHDYLLSKRAAGEGRGHADAVFLAAMEHEGVAWWRRKMMHAGVRAYSVVAS